MVLLHNPKAKADSKGRCPHHPYIQLQRHSQHTGHWVPLLDSCPLCEADDDDDDYDDDYGENAIIEDDVDSMFGAVDVDVAVDIMADVVDTVNDASGEKPIVSGVMNVASGATNGARGNVISGDRSNVDDHININNNDRGKGDGGDGIAHDDVDVNVDCDEDDDPSNITGVNNDSSSSNNNNVDYLTSSLLPLTLILPPPPPPPSPLSLSSSPSIQVLSGDNRSSPSPGRSFPLMATTIDVRNDIGTPHSPITPPASPSPLVINFCASSSDNNNGSNYDNNKHSNYGSDVKFKRRDKYSAHNFVLPNNNPSSPLLDLLERGLCRSDVNFYSGDGNGFGVGVGQVLVEDESVKRLSIPSLEHTNASNNNNSSSSSSSDISKSKTPPRHHQNFYPPPRPPPPRHDQRPGSAKVLHSPSSSSSQNRLLSDHSLPSWPLPLNSNKKAPFPPKPPFQRSSKDETLSQIKPQGISSSSSSVCSTLAQVGITAESVPTTHNDHQPTPPYREHDNDDDDDDDDLLRDIDNSRCLSLDADVIGADIIDKYHSYDPKGRCVHHPRNRLRKKKHFFGKGSWKVLMKACPDCLVEAMDEIRSSENFHSSRDGENDGGLGEDGECKDKEEEMLHPRRDGDNATNKDTIKNGSKRSSSSGSVDARKNNTQASSGETPMPQAKRCSSRSSGKFLIRSGEGDDLEGGECKEEMLHRSQDSDNATYKDAIKNDSKRSNSNSSGGVDARKNNSQASSDDITSPAKKCSSTSGRSTEEVRSSRSGADDGLEGGECKEETLHRQDDDNATDKDPIKNGSKRSSSGSGIDAQKNNTEASSDETFMPRAKICSSRSSIAIKNTIQRDCIKAPSSFTTNDTLSTCSVSTFDASTTTAGYSIKLSRRRKGNDANNNEDNFNNSKRGAMDAAPPSVSLNNSSTRSLGNSSSSVRTISLNNSSRSCSINRSSSGGWNNSSSNIRSTSLNNSSRSCCNNRCSSNNGLNNPRKLRAVGGDNLQQVTNSTTSIHHNRDPRSYPPPPFRPVGMPVPSVRSSNVTMPITSPRSSIQSKKRDPKCTTYPPPPVKPASMLPPSARSTITTTSPKNTIQPKTKDPRCAAYPPPPVRPVNMTPPSATTTTTSPKNTTQPKTKDPRCTYLLPPVKPRSMSLTSATSTITTTTTEASSKSSIQSETKDPTCTYPLPPIRPVNMSPSATSTIMATSPKSSIQSRANDARWCTAYPPPPSRHVSKPPPDRSMTTTTTSPKSTIQAETKHPGCTYPLPPIRPDRMSLSDRSMMTTSSTTSPKSTIRSKTKDPRCTYPLPPLRPDRMSSSDRSMMTMTTTTSSKSTAQHKKSKNQSFKNVERMKYTDAHGNRGHYTGMVNVHSVPHGHGVVMYDNGANNDGTWKNGQWMGRRQRAQEQECASSSSSAARLSESESGSTLNHCGSDKEMIISKHCHGRGHGESGSVSRDSVKSSASRHINPKDSNEVVGSGRFKSIGYERKETDNVPSFLLSTPLPRRCSKPKV